MKNFIEAFVYIGCMVFAINLIETGDFDTGWIVVLGVISHLSCKGASELVGAVYELLRDKLRQAA